MSREPTSVDAELARLRTQQPAGDYLVRKGAIFDRQVAEFASVLKPEVQAALKAESCSEVAAEWIAEARRGLATLVPELPDGLELREDFKQAAQQLQADLRRNLETSVLEPGEEEIEEHAHELAQCVLGNWFAILEHAKQDHPGRALSLDFCGLPTTVERQSVYEGIEAFVVPRPDVTSKFEGYVRGLDREGQAVELAPDLYLVVRDGQRYMAPSAKVADELLRPRSKMVRVGSPRWTRPASPSWVSIQQFLTPILDAAPALLGHTAAQAESHVRMHDANFEQQVAMAAAYEATYAPGSGHAKSAGYVSFNLDLELDAARKALSKDLAAFVLLDLDMALDPGWFGIELVNKVRRIVAGKRLATKAGSLTGKQDVIVMSRVAIAATGYAAVGKVLPAQAGEFDRTVVNEFIGTSTEARDVFAMSVQVARQAMAMPQAQGIAEHMKTIAIAGVSSVKL